MATRAARVIRSITICSLRIDADESLVSNELIVNSHELRAFGRGCSGPLGSEIGLQFHKHPTHPTDAVLQVSITTRGSELQIRNVS
jgi:hypothetical protein